MISIEDLEARQKHLKKEIKEVTEQIYHLKLEQHGLSIGCIVIYNGNEFKVSGAEFILEKPWVYGYKLTKKGEWSKVATNLFEDWELK